MINIYIDSNFKGLKGNVEYGYFLEWIRNGEVMNEPGDGKSNIIFGEAKDTRNRVFLMAAIEAIERISEGWMKKDPQRVCVYARCDYLVASMQKSKPQQWIIDGWIKGDRKEVKNRDLWQKLLETIKNKGITEMEWHGGPHKLTEDIIRGIEKKYERPIEAASFSK